MSSIICLNSERENRIIVSGESMRGVIAKVKNLARCVDSILLIGETGVGKDLIAHEIHYTSGRSQKPFITVPLNTLSDQLFESELFGYEKGAFTGADRDKIGILEAADGGTLYFPEISELPPFIQLKLLHFLQYRKFRRVGHNPRNPELQVNINLIFASNLNPEEGMHRGKLRSDFYYRISTNQIYIPPLRERKDEIRILSEYFLRLCSHKFTDREIIISEKANERLLGYHWPGNVRELRGVIERSLVLLSMNTNGGNGHIELQPEHIEYFGENRLSGNTVDYSDVFSAWSEIPQYKFEVGKFRSAYFAELLRRTGGNRSEAARIAGLSKRGFLKAIKHIE
jgi:transcriptional regulator with PAS, ATPase and Fis domain